MDEMVKLAEKFGLATALLIALCIFLWRVLVWFKPWGEKLFVAILTMITTVSDNQKKLADKLKDWPSDTNEICQFERTLQKMGIKQRHIEKLMAMKARNEDKGADNGLGSDSF